MPIARLLSRFVTALSRTSRNRSPHDASRVSFQAMVEQSGDVICHVVDGHFTYVSPSAHALFGWDPDAMIGTTGFFLVHPPDLPILEAVIDRRLNGTADNAERHQLRVICADGSLAWTETSARSEQNRMGFNRTTLVIRDITKQKRLEEELEALALRDALTGLGNRRCFDVVLDRAWRQTLRNGGEMALLLLDVDHFKQFNDQYGHQAGDDCLRVVALTLDGFARRPSDLACRYGGEEFALILSNINATSAIDLAEQIRHAIADLALPHAPAIGNGRVTASIGVATAVARLGGSVRMPEGLLQAADLALYKAKAAGRDRVESAVVLAPTAAN